MAALDAIIVSRLEPSLLLGLEQHLLEIVPTRNCRPALIIYTMAERAISIGRYHLYDGPANRNGISAWRRLTGGRVCGAGEGWLGVALILPDRTSLLREQDAHLKADQVMNRYARGVLGGLRALGLDCFYPGRDAITVDRREIAMCSFETNARGALLFELMLAVDRGLEDLIHDLEHFDPGGSLSAPMYDRESATTVARALGRNVTFAEIAEAIEDGYARMLGETERRDLTAAERSEAERRGAAIIASEWLNDRKPDPTLDKVSRAGSQLGFVEADLRLRNNGAIDRLTLAGDFIANSPALDRFERELAGKPLELPTVSAEAIRIFGDGANYILGMGELTNLVKLVMKAA